jgi:hypothetical protein
MINKITVRLVGGLGNQLFIYAFGLATAKKAGKELIIDDLSGFSHRDIYRAEFCLNAFSLKETLLSTSKYKYLIANRYFWALARKFGLSHVEKDDSKYNSEAMESNSVFFEGYWQSYLYFHEFKRTIKSNLQLVNKNDPKISDFKKQILNAKNSVAIGMRFYESFSKDKQRYSVQNESYYSKAIDLIESKVKNLTYFVFSMNTERAKSELAKHDDKNIVFVNPLICLVDAPLDMYLMSLCDHFIISNSTMYWWAAYLGEVDESLVIAPAVGLSNKDSLLPNWIKLR